MRISLDDDLYWKLVSLASDKKMRYYELLEAWIRDADSHRDVKTDKPLEPPCPTREVRPDSRKPRGTFSQAEIDQIKAMHREGQSPGRIAKSMGRHKSSVAYAVASMKKRGEL